MNHLRVGSGAISALMLLILPTPIMAADVQGTAAQSSKQQPVPADDVPAPPMSLLFGIGAVGLIWGRRLAATARKKQESAESE